MKYIYQFQGQFEIESEKEEDAKKLANEKFKTLDIEISDVKVVDKGTGYILK